MLSYFYIYVIISIVYVLIKQKKGPNDKTHSKSHHLNTDTISEIIDRIEWSLLRPTRVNYITRYLMWGLWITFISIFLISSEFPSAGVFLRNWVAISIILLCLHGFYDWHSDKFSSFTSLNALNALRKKIGVKKGDVKTLKSYYDNNTSNGSDESWTFSYYDYLLGTRFPE